MRRYLSAALVLLVLLVAQLGAQVPRFTEGDRIAFLGDSIFHGGKVHANLLLFYATRFPDAPIAVRNAGVSGDMASGAINRIEWDVEPFDPNAVVIMLGMNDVGRWLYGEGKDTPANIAQRKRLIDTHIQRTRGIVERLTQKPRTIILCTPTPYDQTAQRPGDNAVGVDDALATVAENVRKFAAEAGHPLVDFHAGMRAVLDEQQQKDPAFTMMDAARVHPDDAGHMVMTYLFLKAQGISPTVADMVVDAQGAKVVSADNCELSELRADESGVSFVYLARSLPYPVEGRAADALAWVPFTEELNQEKLTVENLAPGTYRVSIDGEAIGNWTSGQLAEGINLAVIRSTPQYRQAKEIADLNERRRARENATLRVFAALEHDVLRAKQVDTSDMEAVKQAMEEAIKEEQAKKSWRVNYFKNLTRAYLAEKPRQQQIEKELADQAAKMFELAKPKPRRVEIVRAENQ